MTTAMFRLRPGDTGLVLRPFMGGADLPFNTRWRDVVIGETKPTAANTGTIPGVARGVRDIGIMEITTPTVIRDMDLTGRILARAPLKLYNCKLDLGTQFGNAIEALRRYPVELVDCEITASGTPNVSNVGVLGSHVRMVRCNVHRVVDPVDVSPSGAFGADPASDLEMDILACYLHDFSYISPDPNHAGGGVGGDDNRTHNDGVQIMGGANLVVRGNNIEGTLTVTVNPGGSPPDPGHAHGVLLTPLAAVATDVLIEKNWLDYGSLGVSGSGYPYGIVRALVRDNRFGPNFTPFDAGDGLNVPRPLLFVEGEDWTGMPSTSGALDTNGNIWESTGLPVPVYRRSA